MRASAGVRPLDKTLYRSVQAVRLSLLQELP